jgi:hypothetical protein
MNQIGSVLLETRPNCRQQRKKFCLIRYIFRHTYQAISIKIHKTFRFIILSEQAVTSHMFYWKLFPYIRHQLNKSAAADQPEDQFQQNDITKIAT